MTGSTASEASAPRRQPLAVGLLVLLALLLAGAGGLRKASEANEARTDWPDLRVRPTRSALAARDSVPPAPPAATVGRPAAPVAPISGRPAPGPASAPAPVAAPPAPAPVSADPAPATTPEGERVDPAGLRVSRVVFDAADPDATFAVVGGVAVRRGDRVGGWRVFRVERDRLLLGDEGEVILPVADEEVR